MDLQDLLPKNQKKLYGYHKEFNEPINNVTDLIFDSHYINQIEILKPKIPISDHLPIISFFTGSPLNIFLGDFWKM